MASLGIRSLGLSPMVPTLWPSPAVARAAPLTPRGLANERALELQQYTKVAREAIEVDADVLHGTECSSPPGSPRPPAVAPPAPFATSTPTSLSTQLSEERQQQRQQRRQRRRETHERLTAQLTGTRSSSTATPATPPTPPPPTAAAALTTKTQSTSRGEALVRCHAASQLAATA